MRTPRRVRLPLALLVFLLLPGAQAGAQTPPRVRLLATGGTISNRAGGRLTADDLIKSMPGLERYARPEYEQFANVASSQITLAQWLQLARRINELFTQDPELAGIVVTSGTDTLEETAYFLHLTVRDARPVVVVGSMRNPSTLGYEGAANLMEGFRVAADPQARSKGVLVVMNDEINSAREVTKTDALRLETFQSRSYGLLGVVDSDRVVFYRESLKRHTAKSEFDVAKIAALPRVDVVMVYQDAPGDLIASAVEHGARGIVIAAAGAGATSGTQVEAMLAAAGKGVFIVTSTRTGSGRVAARRFPAAAPATSTGTVPQRPSTFLAAEDLSPVKARILLMLALTRTSDAAEIQRMFTEY
ncbi:MAG: asparaginase [Bacteroidales bacterium]